MSAASVRATSRWITRIIPVILGASVGYATYVVVDRICVDYLISGPGDDGVAIAILILYFITFLFMVATYLRTIWVINTDAGLVPLGPLAVERRQQEQSRKNRLRREGDLESQPYYAGPDPSPDSPGLEEFYSREVFVCENDGRPKWCSDCCNWKPDRAHHSSEIDRCVIRMDHYCPWVGGIIGENAFKFFVQFTMYTACFCGVVLGAAGSTLKQKLAAGDVLDAHLVAIIALAGFYGLFTGLLTLTSWRYITTNMTNVDVLGAKSKVYQLAVRIPRGSERTDKYHTVTYPLMRPGEARTDRAHGTTTDHVTQSDGAGELQARRVRERDDLAYRTFAILRTEPGENPWDLGFWRNWQEVMGTSILDWFLPIRRSPCVDHDDPKSFYQMGSVMRDIRARYGIDEKSTDETDMMELRNLSRNMA
ncbi:palmitoyltransferase PFA5 [Xylariales sp. PMI_506]|nr:palmitoyltransferase PFA5 [Xylariales sp. PMI_506]